MIVGALLVAPAAVRKLIDQLKAYFDGMKVRPSAVLDLSAVTPFQRAVFREARAIPRGRLVGVPPQGPNSVSSTIAMPAACGIIASSLPSDVTAANS